MRVRIVFSVVGSRFWASSIDDDLAVQRAAAQERDRLQRQLAARRQLVDQAAGVAAAALVGEGDDRVVDRRHPRVELLVEPAGQEADIGAADRHERPVDGEAFVARLLDDLLEPGGDGQQRLAGAGPAVEGDDADRRDRAAARARTAAPSTARPQAPRLGRRVWRAARTRRRRGGRAPTANRTAARRTRSRAIVRRPRRPTSTVTRAGGVQAVDHLVGRLDRRPPDRPRGRGRAGRLVLGRRDAEVGGLDAQRGVVGHHRTWAPMRGLAERGADDAVVGHGRVEAVLDQEVLLDAVDLDLQRACRRPAPARRASRRGGPAAPRSCAARSRAARPTSSGRLFNPSSSSTTVSGITTSTSPKRVDAGRVGDQHRRVEHHRVLVPDLRLPIAGPFLLRRIATRLFSLDEFGHRHSSSASIDIPIGIMWSEVSQRLVVVSHGRRSMVDGGHRQASWRRERDLCVLRNRTRRGRRPTSSGSDESWWHSSIDPRCSTVTRSSCRAGTW